MTTAIKERPILFSAPMVRAILDGRKVMTRRVVNPEIPFHGDIAYPSPSVPGAWNFRSREYHQAALSNFPLQCPYGVPGDRLYVKETWTPDHAAFYPNFPVVYRADYAPGTEPEVVKGKTFSPEQKAWYPFKWRSSRYMPRAVARIHLEVTGVRVERLQEITEADASAEGFEFREHFIRLWDKINGTGNPKSWDSDPWVWCVSFRRVENATHQSQ